jgi:hypothetical protein
VLLYGDLNNVVSGTWYYRDELVKRGGQWRFSLRYVRQFPKSEAPDDAAGS